jgi:hypothetical protein
MNAGTEEQKGNRENAAQLFSKAEILKIRAANRSLLSLNSSELSNLSQLTDPNTSSIFAYCYLDIVNCLSSLYSL